MKGGTVEEFFVSRNLNNIEAEFGSSCFKLLFKFKEDNNIFFLLLREPLFLRPKHFMTHLSIISFLSLLKKSISISYFDIYITFIKFQRPLAMTVNFLYNAILLTEWFLM